jgi:hypothetical protein
LGVLAKRLPPWLPLAIGVLSALAVLVRLPRIIAALYANGDAASAPVIGSLLSAAPAGRTVLLGQYPWYESFWMMQLTRSLPGHREIWEAVPIVLTAVAYALLVGTTWWCFGRTRALLLAALLLSTTAQLRTVLFTLNFHGAVVVHACVLIASLVFVLANERLSGWALMGLTMLVGGFTALGVASDQIMFIGAILPLLLTAGVLWARHPGHRERRAALYAVGVCAIAVLGGELAAAAMRHDKIVPAPFQLVFVPVGRLAGNLEIFASAFTNLAGGNFLGANATRGGYVKLACGLLAVSALAMAVAWVWRRLPTLRAPAPEESGREAARTAYILFWSLLLACLTAGFLLTSTPVDANSDRYVAADLVAVAALLTCLAPVRRTITHGVLVLGITVFSALTLYSNIAHPTGDPIGFPTGRTVGEVERYLLEHHATRGYAPYWDAADISWATHLRIQAYPLQTCSTPLGVCPMGLHQISSWYQPSGASATFLLTDLSQVGNVPLPDPFGAPVAQAVFGSVIVYIFNHDVATALQTPGTS